jgi:vitamin B12 transporter
MAAHTVDELDQNQSADFLDTNRNTLDWQNDIVLSERQTLTAGLLWQDEEADSESFGLPYGADTTTSQLYLQDQVAMGPHRWLFGAAYTDHETFGGHVTWNAEYGYEFAGGALLAASAGTGFRAPDATDLYGFGGNPDLEPEESQSFELRYRQPLGERQSVSLAAFRNDIDELIDFFVIDPDTFEGENRNIESARIDGIEAGWQVDGERWSANVAATLQDPRDRATDERLLRRAREIFTAGVARRFGDSEVALDVLYSGERRDFGFPSQTVLPSYWLANLSARIVLAERFTLLLRAENLFDEDYELASGYNTMGQSFFGALRYEFR